MELPEKIAGLDGRKVRDMFKAMMATEIKMEWNDGAPSIELRRVTPELIETSLNVPKAEALRIQADLVAEGWIEPSKFVPTMPGMALSHHVDRPKLARDEAEEILERVLAWADGVNAEPDARVKVRTIDLFGSMQRGAAEVGDIDLFVVFTTMDLGMDLQPEDQEREDELTKELVSISEYISPSSELDQMCMGAPSTRVFPRPV